MVSDSNSSDESGAEDPGSPMEEEGDLGVSLPPDSLFSLDEYLELYRVASSETAYRVLVALARNDRLSATELVEVTGRQDNDLHYYLRKLKRSALIENRRDPNTGTSETYSYYVLTDLGHTVLEHGLADGVKRLAEQETVIAEEYAT